MIIQFKNGEINFVTLKSMFENYGLTIEAIPYDFSTRKMTIIETDTIKERISSTNFGISEYQEAVISILRTQLNHSYDKDENLKVERRKWKKGIDELKLELSKNNNFNK